MYLRGDREQRNRLRLCSPPQLHLLKIWSSTSSPRAHRPQQVPRRSPNHHTARHLSRMSRESPQYSSFPRPTSQHRDSYNQNNPQTHRSPTSPQGPGSSYGYGDNIYSDQPRTASSSHYQLQSQYRDHDRRDRGYDEEHYDNPFSNPQSHRRGYEDDTPDGAGGAGGYTDDQFNVAMDFNNAGPRYAEVYGGQRGEDMAQLAAGARPVSMYVMCAANRSLLLHTAFLIVSSG